jgi:hypothetical protein
MTGGSDARVTTDEALAHELHQLGEAVAALREEVRRSAGALLPRDDDAGWDETPASAHSWVSTLATPQRATVRIPRLPLELAFIAAAAVLAGVADLRPAEIAAAMAAAWVIVALAEWAGSRGDRLRAQVYLAPIGVAREPDPAEARADPSWFTPPVEHTLLTSPEQATGIVKLPPADDQEQSTAIVTLPPAEDPETTAERRAEA